jgi:TM2 domain-containing membrane protein YozV
MGNPNQYKRRINPGVSVVLSFLFSGLGQIYNGEIMKGLIIMVFSAIGMLVFLVGASCIFYSIISGFSKIWAMVCGLIMISGGILIIAVAGIYNLFDAYNVACKKNLDE